MPVFSRRLCKKIVFLGVNLAVQVAAVRAGLLQPRPGTPPGTALEREAVRPRAAPRQRDDLRRLVGERLRTAGSAVGLARLQLRIGNAEDAAATLERLHEEIQSLRRQLNGGRKPVRPVPRKPRPHGDGRREGERLAGSPG
jgi:hypothetical protein